MITKHQVVLCKAQDQPFAEETIFTVSESDGGDGFDEQLCVPTELAEQFGTDVITVTVELGDQLNKSCGHRRIYHDEWCVLQSGHRRDHTDGRISWPADARG